MYKLGKVYKVIYELYDQFDVHIFYTDSFIKFTRTLKHYMMSTLSFKYKNHFTSKLT